jgi:alkanesulfonate monooxygenase SsuD/methylene tetrahydromethanopterin reductase-like flavin-dependent oxidoreductase (luciferase family)
VRLGVSLRSGYLVDDARTEARWMVEQARASRDAGLDRLFVGDHHGVPVPYYQNTPMLGRLLAEWGDRPAGALYLLPLWNPVLVAEQVGTLAAIAAGRSGGPERVAHELRGLASLGFTDVIVRHLVDDQREVLASTERLAQVRTALADA